MLQIYDFFVPELTSYFPASLLVLWIFNVWPKFHFLKASINLVLGPKERCGQMVVVVSHTCL